jgi:hypothetical protein
MKGQTHGTSTTAWSYSHVSQPSNAGLDQHERLKDETAILQWQSQTAHLSDAWIGKLWGPTHTIPLLETIQLMLIRFDIGLLPVQFGSKASTRAHALSRGVVA